MMILKEVNRVNIRAFIFNSAFVQSFRSLDKKFVHILFLDYLYYVILLFVGSFYWYRVLPLFLSVLESADLLQNIQTFSSTEEFVTSIQAIGMQWSAFKWYSLGVGVILFFNYVFFKYLVWAKIQKKYEKHEQWKRVAKKIWLFALVNLVVVLSLVLFLVASWYLFVLETFNIMFFFVVPLLFIFIMNVIHPLFVQTGTFQETFVAFFRVGIQKWYVWIIPHLFMLLGLYVVMEIVPLLLFLPDAAYFVWYVLCFAAYLCWAKYYIYAVLEKTWRTK